MNVRLAIETTTFIEGVPLSVVVKTLEEVVVFSVKEVFDFKICSVRRVTTLHIPPVLHIPVRIHRNFFLIAFFKVICLAAVL